MRHKHILTLTLAVLAPVAAPLAAHAAGPSYVDARLSTLGLGAEFGYKASPHWTLRAQANAFDYDYDTTADQIKYNGKLKLGSFGLLADYHFTENSPFYVSAGLYANGNKINATADPAAQTDIGGLPFTPEQIGTLSARAKFKSTAPYLGLGFRWGAGPVSLNLEAGAYFQGSPTVTLTSNGTLASQPVYQQALERERQDLQNDVDDLKTYPVVAASIGYKF